MLQHNEPNWKSIANALNQCFPASYSTDIQCLHRWQKVLHPDLKKGPWTGEEDTTLRSLVQKDGTKKMVGYSETGARKRCKSIVEKITPVPDSATLQESDTLSRNEFEGWQNPMAVAVTGTDNENDANVFGHRNIEQISAEVLGDLVGERPHNALADSGTDGNHQPNFYTPCGSPIRQGLNPPDVMMVETLVHSSPNDWAQLPFETLPLDSIGDEVVPGSDGLSKTLSRLPHWESPESQFLEILFPNH